MSPEIVAHIDLSDVGGLAQFLAEHPRSRIVRSTPLPIEVSRPEWELPWIEEVQRLSDLVETSRSLVEREDPVILQNYKQLKKEIGYGYSSSLDSMNENDFAQYTLAVFDASLEAFREHDSRPAFENTIGGHTMIVYKNLGSDVMSPRGMRFLIYGHALAGQGKSRLELRAMEDVYRVRDRMSRYESNLGHHVRRLEFNQRQNTSRAV